MTRSILIVEDEHDLAYLLTRNLEVEGFSITVANDGQSAIDLVRKNSFSLIILDLMLPKRSGLEVLREIRSKNRTLPVIILTARAGVEDRVAGLKLGADDYISKPFEMAELVARVQAVLRRSTETPLPKAITINDLHIDFERMHAQRGEMEITLSSRELHILRVLAQHRGQTVTREELLRAVWSFDEAVTERTVDAHIKNLRKKIEVNPGNPQYLRTIHREGYMLTL